MWGVLNLKGEKRVKKIYLISSSYDGEWQLYYGDGSDFEKCGPIVEETYLVMTACDLVWLAKARRGESFLAKIKISPRYYPPLHLRVPMTLLGLMSYGIPCINSDCMCLAHAI